MGSHFRVGGVGLFWFLFARLYCFIQVLVHLVMAVLLTYRFNAI